MIIGVTVPASRGTVTVRERTASTVPVKRMAPAEGDTAAAAGGGALDVSAPRHDATITAMARHPHPQGSERRTTLQFMVGLDL
jgi:hypothetical protein